MRTLTWMITVFGLAAFASNAQAIVLGQVDDFEDGTTKNWTNGAPATDPVNITTGGPAGVNDNYLRITSVGGAGAGSRMLAFNRTQWLGNYTTANVGAVEMDLLNLGASPLSIRLAIKQNITAGSSGYVTTTPFSLATDSAWHHATFVLNTSNMTLVGGPLTLSTLLAAPAEVRIISAAGVSLNGDAIAAQLGVDNVFAQIPEPASLALLAVGAAAMIRRHRGQAYFMQIPF